MLQLRPTGFGHRLSRQPCRLWRRSLTSSPLAISPQVTAALRAGEPVVALESTIYTHGLPRQASLSLFSHLDSVVRSYGVVPAHIAVLGGQARVGLDLDDLHRLLDGDVVRVDGSASSLIRPQKLSRRDLAPAVAAGRSGGTTVAATLAIAHRAGIAIFATGGLGGVHRHAPESWDVSADLAEMARCPIGVVSAGVKAFLDVPKTVEHLESLGVGVVVFADEQDGDDKSVEFPAFWSRKSGVRAPTVVRSEVEAAAVLAAQRALNLETGILFANPIGRQDEIPKEQMDVFIDRALAEVEDGGMGRDETPFVLGRIAELTAGKSVAVNKTLVESNVRRACLIARELARLERIDRPGVAMRDNRRVSRAGLPDQNAPTGRFVVAGGLFLDTVCTMPKLVIDTSSPATMSHSAGGVGFNLAKALSLLDPAAIVQFHSAVGEDVSGKILLDQIGRLRIQSHVKVEAGRTGEYVVIDGGKSMVAAADAGVVDSLGVGHVDQVGGKTSDWLVLDTNISSASLAGWIRKAVETDMAVAIEPVSCPKAGRIIEALSQITDECQPGDGPDQLTRTTSPVSVVSPNEAELESLCSAVQHAGGSCSRTAVSPDHIWDQLSSHGQYAVWNQTGLKHLVTRVLNLAPFFGLVLVTLGRKGVFIASRIGRSDRFTYSSSYSNITLDKSVGPEQVYLRHFPAVRLPHEIEDGSAQMAGSCTGAGDCLLAAFLAAVRSGATVEQAVLFGQRVAVKTMGERESVSDKLVEMAGRW